MLLPRLIELLPAYGPWLLFALAFLETSFVTGLVIPAGIATSVATAMALEGTLELPSLVMGAALGGVLGDSVGFWVGRKWGGRVLYEERWGRLGKTARQRREKFSSLLQRHPIYSVTLARTVAFVRTLMPMAAGTSQLRYGLFLPYEIVGVAGWLTIYVGIGFFARESWVLVGRWIGYGGALAFSIAAVALWVAKPRRLGRRASAD